jgi:hypothetical protein
MINFEMLRLMHKHGDSEYVAMTESREHGSADHDPEQGWIRGARIFKCDTCSDEVIVIPPGEEPGESVQ